MPDVEPPREGRTSQPGVIQDEADLQPVCSGRRRVCALLNSPSPGFNKALDHIQEMKTKVVNWYKQSGKYYPQFDPDTHQNNKLFRYQSTDSDSESAASIELNVEGIAIIAREKCPLLQQWKKISDVLWGAMCLIERLEADRQYAEEALHKEKRRRRLLEKEVDSISLLKQQEHDNEVKKAEEACKREIADLGSQLKQKREELDQGLKSLSKTEQENQSLHEGITFATKQISFLNEKLIVQKGIVNQINTALAEADELQSKTESDLLAAQKEFKIMELEANQEKALMENSLTVINNKLAIKMNDLNHLKVLQKCLCTDIENIEKEIDLTEEKCAAITQRIPELMELQKTEKDQILQFKYQIEEEMQKNKKLKEKLTALQGDIEKARLRGEAEVSCVEEQLRSKQNAFAAVCKGNIECKQNLEDYKIKLVESEKAVKQMREERKQMLQKIIDNDEQWGKAKEELTQVVARHSVTQTRLEEQEQLTFMEEQRAREEIENLRKNLTGQMNAQELLKTHCANMKDKLNQQRRDSELTNKKLQKEYEEASLQTNALETKTEKIKKLTENLEAMECEHRNTLVNLEQERRLKCDQLKAAQDLHSATVERYDSTVGRISDLMKMCEEYQDASDKMDKIFESLPCIIAELQSVHDVVEFKHNSAALIMSTLQSDINNCQQRKQRSMQIHTAHVTARKKAEKDTEDALEIALRKNQQLASVYEILQKTVIKAKQEEGSARTKKDHAHRLYEFYRKLSLLQKGMHKALVKNLEQRSVYSQAELDRCQALSRESDQKVKSLQEAMSEEIRLISASLQSLTDDSTTSNDAGVNKQASPDAAGSNEEMPSVQTAV